MKDRSLCAIVIGLCAGQAAFADLTMRHTIDFKFGSFLPPAAVEAMKTQLADQLPKESLVLIKDKKVLTSLGRMVMLADYSKGVITLMDTKTKQFASSPLASYADQVAAIQKQRMPILPQQAQQLFSSMKFDVKTEQTGKKAVIQEIGTEENLLVILVEIPNPSGAPMQMRMEMHRWIASPEEANRVPALKELELYGSLPKSGLDPVEMMTKSLANFPGLADKLQGSLKDLTRNAGKAMPRMQMALYAPAMAAMFGSGAAGQPFAEFSMELTELSSAPLPDSRFEVPADYQSAPMEELIGVLFPAPKLPVPPAGPKKEIPAGKDK